MQFDKNRFKESFRMWVVANPNASEQEALQYCQSQIPAKSIVSQYWLIEQSVQWFSWIKAKRKIDGDAAEFHDEHSDTAAAVSSEDFH